MRRTGLPTLVGHFHFPTRQHYFSILGKGCVATEPQTSDPPTLTRKPPSRSRRLPCLGLLHSRHTHSFHPLHPPQRGTVGGRSRSAPHALPATPTLTGLSPPPVLHKLSPSAFALREAGSLLGTWSKVSPYFPTAPQDSTARSWAGDPQVFTEAHCHCLRPGVCFVWTHLDPVPGHSRVHGLLLN